MFEVEHLKYATLATVSRCGMIWFSEDVVEPSMVFRHYLETLSTVPLDAEDDEATKPKPAAKKSRAKKADAEADEPKAKAPKRKTKAKKAAVEADGEDED